jgi:hypothetical protein
VQLLARPGRLNDQPALIAQQIRAKDRTVQIEQREGRRITSRRQEQAGPDGQRGQR